MYESFSKNTRNNNMLKSYVSNSSLSRAHEAERAFQYFEHDGNSTLIKYILYILYR